MRFKNTEDGTGSPRSFSPRHGFGRRGGPGAGFGGAGFDGGAGCGPDGHEGRGRGPFGAGPAGFGTGGFGPGFGPRGPHDEGGRGPFGGPVGGPGGFGGPGGPGGRRGRGGRARRGDVRHAILAILADEPANGYGVIKGIEERTGGVWRTSPGSVYPTLAQLADEGLIAPVEGATGSGTTYALTEAGGTYVTEHSAELASVWAPASETWAEVGDMMLAGRKLMEVLRQVAQNGTDDQRKAATTKMDDLRRELYRMLGE